MDSLRNKLAGLSSLLGRGVPGEAHGSPCISVSVSPRRTGQLRPAAAAAAHAPPPPARNFQSTVRPGVVLGTHNNVRDAPLGGLIAKMKDAEAAWLKVSLQAAGTTGEPKRQGWRAAVERPSTILACLQEKGKLVMANKAEAARRQKAEAELRRVSEQLSYSRGEAKHLKVRRCWVLLGGGARSAPCHCKVQCTPQQQQLLRNLTHAAGGAARARRPAGRAGGPSARVRAGGGRRAHRGGDGAPGARCDSAACGWVGVLGVEALALAGNTRSTAPS